MESKAAVENRWILAWSTGAPVFSETTSPLSEQSPLGRRSLGPRDSSCRRKDESVEPAWLRLLLVSIAAADGTKTGPGLGRAPRRTVPSAAKHSRKLKAHVQAEQRVIWVTGLCCGSRRLRTRDSSPPSNNATVGMCRVFIRIRSPISESNSRYSSTPTPPARTQLSQIRSRSWVSCRLASQMSEWKKNMASSNRWKRFTQQSPRSICANSWARTMRRSFAEASSYIRRGSRMTGRRTPKHTGPGSCSVSRTSSPWRDKSPASSPGSVGTAER